MLKKLISLLFVVIFLSACAKNEQKEEIVFSSWGSVTEVQVLNHVIENFEQKNPNIKINFIHIPQNYFQKLHLLFAASTPPDVIFINSLYLPVYSDELMDLSQIIDFSAFYKNSTEALSVEGKNLAVPRDISNFVLYYNKNIISNPKIKDLTELEHVLSQITTQNHWGISFERDIFLAEPYTLTLGFDKGITFYKNMEGKYTPMPSDIGSSTLAQMFLDEKLAFYLSGRWMYPKINESAKFPFGIITFPATVPADSSGWAISKKTKHKDAAILFIKFLSSKESIDYFTKSGLIVPARKDSSELLNNTKERVFIEAISKSQRVERGKDYNKQRDMLNKQYFK